MTHGNIIAELAGVFHCDLNFTIEEIHMSYLPLAHSFERVLACAIVAIGGGIGFFQGSIPELFNDINELKPTFLAGAPRVWQRLHDKMWSTINSGSWLKRQLFSWGLSSKIASTKVLILLLLLFLTCNQAGGSSPIWDSVLFSQTKAKLGGRVRFIVSGSAPLDPKLADFLRTCFCCPVIQGYGLTESILTRFSGFYNYFD